MNKMFDYNGHAVSTSKPVKTLRTVKKVLSIDSADRDVSRYYTNGDFVIYLPRQYQNVVAIRVMSGEFPPLVSVTSGPGARTHPYSVGSNSNATVYSSDTALTSNTYYFLLDIEGLNYSDETSVAANRSSYRDGFLAKIPAVLNGSFIEYNDHSGQDNVTRFTPALGTLDRLHIRVRTHAQQGNTGFVYWTSDGAVAASSNRTVDFTLSLEIEMLENAFDDFSSMETRLTDRA
jgi:hypothetical protein